MEEKTVAHEIAERQRSISVAEFFEKNRHLLGFDSKIKAILTCVKEATDNSLDASEEMIFSIKKKAEEVMKDFENAKAKGQVKKLETAKNELEKLKDEVTDVLPNVKIIIEEAQQEYKILDSSRTERGFMIIRNDGKHTIRIDDNEINFERSRMGEFKLTKDNAVINLDKKDEHFEIEYSADGKKHKMTTQKTTTNRYKVSVEDNGPGVIPDQIPKVFGRLLYGSKFQPTSNKQSLTWDEPILIYVNGKAELKPIGEFVDQFVKEEGSAAIDESNAFVPAFDWKEYRYTLKKISNVIKHKRENEIVELLLESNRKIKVTGCHSLFTFDPKEKKIKEAEARNLNVNDFIAIPRKLPSGNAETINILDYIAADKIKHNWLYVYGINNLAELFNNAEIIHKKTNKSRKYYRLYTKHGIIDVLNDSMKQYTEKGFLPLHLFLKLNLHAEDTMYIQTYYHGKATKIPIIWSLTPNIMRFLGLFVAEGHTDKRQAAFTFGQHENYLVEEVTKTAILLGSSVTIERRESSIRVKFFGNILSILIEDLCGKGAHKKKVPEFVFRTSEELRQHFLDGLYVGDGHKVPKRNQLMLATVSKRLANEVAYLWLMQGVVASLQKRMNHGLGKTPSICYGVNVYGANINKSFVFKTNKPFKGGTFSSNKYLLKYRQSMLSESDLCLVKIKEKRVIDEGNEFVYDISVPECENFVGGTGGIACHNSRGQQGIGISAAILYAQLTTGKPTKITSKIGEHSPAVFYDILIDTEQNVAEVANHGEDKNFNIKHGTRVELEVEAVYVATGEKSVLEFLRRTSIANPHSEIIFLDPNGEKFVFKRSSAKPPKEPLRIKPHPYGIELGILQRMAKKTDKRTLLSFLTQEFSRVGPILAKKVIKESRLEEDAKPTELSRDESEKLLKNMQKEQIMNPPTDCLSPIGEDKLFKEIEMELKPEFVATITRNPEVYRGMPFQIEAAVAYGGNIPQEGSAKIYRFANKVPLMYEASACATSHAIVNTDWRRYGLTQPSGKGIPQGSIIILLHMASVWVPFTSESKAAIASYPIIIKEMKLSLQECARKLGNYLKKRHAEQRNKMRVNLFVKYSKEIANAIVGLTEKPQAEVDKVMHECLKARYGENYNKQKEETEESDK